MKDLAACVSRLEKFSDGNLRVTLRSIEDHLAKRDIESCSDLNTTLGVDADLLDAAATVKRAAAQINVLIHSIGILHLLPLILEPGECVEYLSLGAGNTGKKFDLETDRQIAEFTFIAWKGGPEAVRHTKLFVDYFHLAEATTSKARNLYVLGPHFPNKLFAGTRSLKSVLSRRRKELDFISQEYEGRFHYVSDYCKHHVGRVKLVDVSGMVPASLLAAVQAVELDDHQ